MPDRAAIRDYTRELTLVEADDIGNDKINNIINQGLRELASRFRWPWLETTTTINVSAGTRSYALPSDFQYMHSLIRASSKIRLRAVSASKALGLYGDDFPTGNAEGFYLWGSTLHLTRDPASAETLNLFYHQAPTILSNDTDSPAFDSQFHLLLADYATSKIWEREEDFVKAKASENRWDDGVEQMARWYQDQTNDMPMVLGEEPTIRATVLNMPWLSDAGIL